MRHIKEILRLKHEHHLSVREIARSSGLPPSTVSDYLGRAQRAGLSWPLPADLSEEQLQRQLLQSEGQESPAPTQPGRPLPEWAEVHKELGRPNVTLRLLWEEYRREFPEGYGYTQFCEYYNRWAGTLDPVLRQVHVPGEKMFVDWAGQTVPIVGPDSSTRQASLFVAVLGASNKTFAEAFENQKLAAWIAGHVHAYAFFNGVSRVTVPDNPKTGVSHPCYYEPKLHRS
jgi:transposase